MAEMTTQDIVKNCDELKGSGQDWQHVYANLQLSVKTPEYRIFRTGNTLFWVHIQSPGVGQVFAFNADPKDKLFQNVLEFLKAMKVAKYTQLQTVMPTTVLFKQLQQAGYSVEVEPLRNQTGPLSFKGVINV